MAESIVQVAPDSTGKKLHTISYTVGANTVEDEVTVPGPYPWAAYSAYGTALSGATAASHIMQIMAGATLKVRITKILIHEIAATVGTVRFEIVRLTSAGTGGGAITPSKLDNADAAAGATMMSLPGVKGAEGAFLWPITVGSAGAAPQSAVNESTWTAHPNSKPIIIPAGVANGIALKCSGLAATTYDVAIEFVETAF